MSAISRRSPSIDIEYDCRGKRKRAHFENSAKGARRFFAKKLEAGKRPIVLRPVEQDYCNVCQTLFPITELSELPPATGKFCPYCAADNMVEDRVY